MSKVLYSRFKLLSILRLFIKKLQVSCLNFALLDPYDLTIVKACHWGLLANLEDNCGFIKPKGNVPPNNKLVQYSTDS
jgi:hypothetical protein